MTIAAIDARKSTEHNGVGDEAKSVTGQIEHARVHVERKRWADEMVRLTIALVVAVVLAACGGASYTDHPESAKSVSVLEQASLAFNDHPSPLTIKAKLDEVLPLYNTPISEENYSRAASALVALRKANGTDEMAILDYMIRSHVPGVKMTFPEMAGISSAMLKADKQ